MGENNEPSERLKDDQNFVPSLTPLRNLTAQLPSTVGNIYLYADRKLRSCISLSNLATSLVAVENL